MTLLERIRALFARVRLLAAGKPWARWLAYSTFTSLALSVSFYLTFPSRELADRVQLEAHRQMDMDVTVGSARPAFPAGVTLKNVEWMTGGSEGDEPVAPQAVKVDAVTVRVGLLGLLTGKRTYSFDARAFGGSLSGTLLSSPKNLAVHADLRDVDLARSPLKAVAGVDMEGKLKEAKLDLEAENGDYSKARGSIKLEGDGLKVKGGTVQHYDLPAVDLGQLVGTVDIDNGKADIGKVEVKGTDLEARLDGFVRLSQHIGTSTLSGKLKLKPSDAWLDKNEMVKAGINFALPAQKDGTHVLNIFGQLAHPTFRPQR